MQTSLPNNAFRQYTPWVIATILLLPLLWLNVRHSQHWGDDFAVYVAQARNIAESKPFDTTTYQFIPSFSSLVPSAPVGFSLLLVPVYKVFGLNIYAFSFFLALIYVLWALASYALWRLYFSSKTSLILLFVGFYINFLLWLKLLITSDVPFALLLMLICLLMQKDFKNKWQKPILLCLLIGLATQTRSIGIVLFPALACFWVQDYFFNKKRISDSNSFQVKQLAFLLIGSATVYAAISYFFRPHSSYISNSASALSLKGIWQAISINAPLYTNSYINLFVSTNESLKQLTFVLGYIMLGCTLAGIVLKWINRIDFFDWVVLFYLLVIIAYPVNADYRYIAPIHPFLIFYAFYCLKIMAKSLRLSTHKVKILIAAGFATVYANHINYLIKTTHETVPGPYEEISWQTFQYLKDSLETNKTVAFNKPRALALYTDIKTTSYNFESNSAVNFNRLHKAGVRYYLHSNSISEEGYNNLIKDNIQNFSVVYKNWQFTLYKDTTQNK
jgi:hypothetical protein